jgi:hypothetical protein
MIAAALGKLYQSGQSPSRSSLEELLPVVLSLKDTEYLRTKGIDLGIDVLEAACKKYLGFTLNELAERYTDESLRAIDNGNFQGRFDPAYDGETNNVLRDMNIIRDQRAIDAIEEAKASGKNILAMAGGSRVRTWKLAVAELYKS